MSDWLSKFVQYKSYGEVGPRLLYWTGVSTIAGALRRKVWFDQEYFQWTPNFYILFVGAPGLIKKSTSIDLGKKLLRQVPGINFGPQIINWQTLIQHVSECREKTDMPDGEIFPHCSVTITLSEFGTFFNPEDRDLVDNLTDLWDGRLDTIKKATKTNGCDELVNPFINIIAATTPRWLAANFPESMVGGGFASRCIVLYAEDSGIDIAYPKRQMPSAELIAKMDDELADELRLIAEYRGEFVMTEAAYAWGEEWYAALKKNIRAMGDSLEAGFISRKQVHLHKLAMIIAASKFKFPVIDVDDLEEADRRLTDLDADSGKIFGFVGQTKVTKAARDIVEIVAKEGAIQRRDLYRKHFFRTMKVNEFREAVDSALMSHLIVEMPGRGLTLKTGPIVQLVK